MMVRLLLVWRVWLLGMALLVFLLGVPVQAQEATEISTPASEMFYFWSSESLFPAGIGFDVVIAHPQTDIAQVTLIVQPEGRDALQIPISVSDNVIYSGGHTELTYIWSIPQDAPVGIFSDVSYTWRVVTNRDEVAEVKSSIVFTDTRAEWETNEDPDGLITLTAPSEGINTTSLRNSIRVVYDLLAANTGQRPQLNIFIYPPSLSFGGCVQDASGQGVVIESKGGKSAPCDVSMVENAIEASGYALLQIPPRSSGLDERSVLTEYLVREFYAPLWRDRTIPDWFRVGLAQFYVPSTKANLLAPVRQAGRNNLLLSLQAMVTAPEPDNSDAATLWRSQSYGMVLYIAQNIGVSGLFDLARNLGTAESFEAAYQAATGQPLTTLLPAWQNWIFKEAADLAYGFYPYLPDTPTPTVTHTPTPTITPTPTVTPTETPTATVTGILSATPLPTFTPSTTPKPPTPTLTPRPAGSLIDTPTPLPSPTPTPTTFTLDPGLGFGIVAVVFLLLGLLSFVYLRITNRR